MIAIQIEQENSLLKVIQIKRETSEYDKCLKWYIAGLDENSKELFNFGEKTLKDCFKHLTAIKGVINVNVYR